MLSRYAALALSAFALSASSLAVVASPDKNTPTPVDTTYTYVGGVNGSSGVAVGPHTFLTAAHVGQGDFTLGSATYHATGIAYAPNGYDLAAVTVSETLPGYYALGTSLATGATVTMVGFGQAGVVNSAGDGYDLSAFGTRHKGNNTFDGRQDVDGEGPSLLSFLKGPGGAALGDRDSGGGWFSGGKLVGISVFIFNNTGYSYNTTDPSGNPVTVNGNGQPNYGFPRSTSVSYDTNGDGINDTTLPANTPYFGSGAIDLTDPRLNSFLTQAVPEPAPFAALAFGALAMLRRRKRG